MKTLLIAIIAVGGALTGVPASQAQHLSIDIGDHGYYNHGPWYYDHGRRLFWVPGHWGPRHHWIHGHYARR